MTVPGIVEGSDFTYGAIAGLGAKKRKQALGLTLEDVVKAAMCILVPPLCFAIVTVVMCFKMRFQQPNGTWVVVALSLIPAVLSGRAASKAHREQLDARWQSLGAVLFVVATVAAAIVGELNYWYFSQPYYMLTSMKSYTEVSPSETDGAQLMDAGTVMFTPGARLGLDMAMSFTSWDIYCVAPITTAEGLPSQGEGLARYDLWAVGVNCCSSGETNFHCGDYDKVDARGGLRQVSAEQRPYFRLAVEQAEAAYNIASEHPTFFYWVKDPINEQNKFFSAAFGNWILANGLHFGINAFIVTVFLIMFNKASKEHDAHLLMALQAS